MTIQTPHNLGDIVFLIHDPEQLERMIINIIVSTNGITYRLICGNTESEHYPIEIANDKSFKLNQRDL